MLKGVRQVVEACRLPAAVRSAFREWVIVHLFRLGRGGPSGFMIAVLDEMGVQDIDDDAEVFGSFLASRFSDFLDGDGASWAGLFRPAPAAPVAVETVAAPRVPSLIGPSLPPERVSGLRARGEPVSDVEDCESGVWDRVEDVESSAGALTPVTSVAEPLPGLPAQQEPPSSVVVAGVDWGDPSSRFSRAACVAFTSGPPVGGPVLKGRYVKWRRRRSVDDPGGGRLPVSGIRSPTIPRSGVGDGSGGAVSGVRALVSDDYHAVVDSELGRKVQLHTVLSWLAENPVRAYQGRVDMVAMFRGAQAGGPYPVGWWVVRVPPDQRLSSSPRVPSLFGDWRGQKALVLDGFPRPVG